MNAEQSRLFWTEVLETTKRLVRDFKMTGVAFEISYGNWIVHRKECPHYHAHVHLVSSNITQVLQSLKDSEILNCKVNSRDKVIDSSDVTVKLPFAPNLETNKWNKFPLFTCINDWFGRLPGFVLRVELKEIEAPSKKENENDNNNDDDHDKDNDNNKNDNDKNNSNNTYFTYQYFIRTGSGDSATLTKLLRSPPKGLKV